MAIIYKIQNKTNGKVYIGQTKRTLDWRLNNAFCGHFTRAFKYNCVSYLCNALRKYGKDGFTYEIVEECNESDLDEREKYWIAFYKSNHIGYNMSNGGKHIYKSYEQKHKKMSEDAKRKISEANKGKQTRLGAVLSEETKRKISEANKGKSLSEETRQKLSMSHKGLCLSEETKRKISETSKGKHKKPATTETKQKISNSVKALWEDKVYRQHMSNAHKGNTNKRGKLCTDEQKQRMSKAHKGKVLTDEQKTERYNKMQQKGTNIMSSETKLKISQANKGRQCSDETRKKISEANKNNQKLKDNVSKSITLHWMLRRGEITKEYYLLYKQKLKNGETIDFDEIRGRTK